MLTQEQQCSLGMNLVTYKEAMARDQEAEEQTTWGPGRRAKHAGDPCSSRWQSTVRDERVRVRLELDRNHGGAADTKWWRDGASANTV